MTREQLVEAFERWEAGDAGGDAELLQALNDYALEGMEPGSPRPFRLEVAGDGIVPGVEICLLAFATFVRRLSGLRFECPTHGLQRCPACLRCVEDLAMARGRWPH